MNAVTSIAAGGLQASYQRFTVGAANIASAGVTAAPPAPPAPGSSQPPVPKGVTANIDVTMELAGMKDAAIAYKANARVLGAAEMLQDSTLRLLG